MEAKQKRNIKKTFSGAQPNKNASQWYGQVHGLILLLLVLNSDQLWSSFVEFS